MKDSVRYWSDDDVPCRYVHYIIRDLSSAPRHSGWHLRDCPTFEPGKYFREQLAWNLYLEVPASGGELVIHRHDARTSPMPDGVAACVMAPAQGDLIIFRSTNVHEVLPAQGRRLTSGGFIGVTDDRMFFFV